MMIAQPDVALSTISCGKTGQTFDKLHNYINYQCERVQRVSFGEITEKGVA